MNRLVLVSAELAPHTEGSVGQAIDHMLRAMSDVDRARTTLLLVDAAIDAGAFGLKYVGVRLVQLDTSVDRDDFAGAREHPPASAYSNTPWHWRSASVFRALAALSKAEPIDYLEFPDLGALGFCTLQERRLTGFLPDTTIAVRLGMPHTARMLSEPWPVGTRDLNLSDLERKCLRDCDCIVSPLPAAADAIRSMFGFAPEEWDARVVRHAPPVLATGKPLAEAVPASEAQAIVFASPLQRRHRPDLFVRAVSGFVRTATLYTGAAMLLAREVDKAYVERIEKLIPPDLQERFMFLEPKQARRQRQAIDDATIVFAGDFDTYGLDAYECALKGARLILNEANPAFGAGTPWQDGVNCLKFDGTLAGLTRALARNFERRETLRVVVPLPDPWPWTVARRTPRTWRSLMDEPPVSVVVAHHNLGAYLHETLDSLVAQSYSNFEVVVVDDASTDPESIRVIDALTDRPAPRLKVIRLAGNVGLAAARNIGIGNATGRYVLTLDADDLIHPRFVAAGVAALENNPDFDIVVTPAGYFIDGAEPPSGTGPIDCHEYVVFCGEAVLGGLVENRFSTATALFRKSVLEQFPYVESLSCYEDWSLFMRLCDAGHRFIVTTDVYFFYRRRQNSMVHSPRDAVRKHIEYSDLIRTSAPLAARQRSRHLLIGLGSPVAAVVGPALVRSADGTVPALAHMLFGDEGQYDEQVAFGALKLSRWLERKTPWLVSGSVWIARAGWRAYRSIRS